MSALFITCEPMLWLWCYRPVLMRLFVGIVARTRTRSRSTRARTFTRMYCTQNILPILTQSQ